MTKYRTFSQIKKAQPRKGNFAELLGDAMTERGVGIKDLASDIDATYEHTRKLVKSLAFPSKYLFEKMCNALSLDKEEARRALVADQMKRKYGNVPLELAGRNPKFERIEQQLPKLTDEQLKMVESVIDSLAKSYRHRQ